MIKTISSFTGEYAFLSNFYVAPFIIKDLEYQTVEHYFQAMKSKIPRYCEMIRLASTPGKAKALGRVRKWEGLYVMRSDWPSVAEKYMLSGVRAKFQQNEELKTKLMDLYGYSLTEGNHWHDNIWGACTCPSCADKPKLNKLGKILMRVRDEIIEDDE